MRNRGACLLDYLVIITLLATRGLYNTAVMFILFSCALLQAAPKKHVGRCRGLLIQTMLGATRSATTLQKTVLLTPVGA